MFSNKRGGAAGVHFRNIIESTTCYRKSGSAFIARRQWYSKRNQAPRSREGPRWCPEDLVTQLLANCDPQVGPHSSGVSSGRLTLSSHVCGSTPRCSSPSAP
jgi:hypothetical protein